MEPCPAFGQLRKCQPLRPIWPPRSAFWAIATRLATLHFAYVDDEGFINSTEHVVLFTFHPYPVAGRVLVFAKGKEGDEGDCELSPEEIRAMIRGFGKVNHKEPEPEPAPEAS